MPLDLPRNHVLYDEEPAYLRNGLVGWWTFDDGTAQDASGFQKNGTLGNSPTFLAGIVPGIGQAPGALNFVRASNNYITLPASVFSGNKLTIAAWAWFNTVNTYQAIFSCFTSDSNSVELFVDSGGSEIFGGNYAGRATSASGSIGTGKWYHVAVTSDGTNWRCYVNGAASGTLGTVSFTTFNIASYVGGRATSGTFAFNGRLDDVRAYNRALSGGEINALYNSALSRAWSEGEWPVLHAASSAVVYRRPSSSFGARVGSRQAA